MRQSDATITNAAPMVRERTRRNVGVLVVRIIFVLSFMHAAFPFLEIVALATPGTDGPSKSMQLQAPHPELSPSERFQELAAICEEQDIDTWDVYGDFQQSSGSLSSFLRNFEAEVAKEFGKQDAVFMPSGVMAQSIALLIHHQNQQRENKRKFKVFACHPTSHLLLHEEEGFRILCGFEARCIKSSTHHDTGRGLGAPPMTLEHLQNTNVEDVSTVILELPHRELGGKLTPWEDVLQMEKYLHAKAIAFHCDGARIFEASAGYRKSLAELADPFDSVYVSFYKGLGGLSGAMLLGTDEFCQEARKWLRRFGGNLFTLLPYAVSARAGYQRHWKLERILDPGSVGMSFGEKQEKLVRIVDRLTRSLNGSATNFSTIACFEPRIPEVCMVHIYLRPSAEECTRIRDACEQECGISLFRRIRSLGEGDDAYEKGYKSMMEITMGETNGRIPDDVWVDAWSNFANRAIAVYKDLECFDG